MAIYNPLTHGPNLAEHQEQFLDGSVLRLMDQLGEVPKMLSQD